MKRIFYPMTLTGEDRLWTGKVPASVGHLPILRFVIAPRIKDDIDTVLVESILFDDREQLVAPIPNAVFLYYPFDISWERTKEGTAIAVKTDRPIAGAAVVFGWREFLSSGITPTPPWLPR